jgi:hypothetical protein
MTEFQITTPTSYGRQSQLQQLSDTLDPSKTGRKGIVLYGIGGPGKTQLALQYVEQNKQQFKAIFWINANTTGQIAQSFSYAALKITRSWPAKDLPNTYVGEEPSLLVRARLRSTIKQQWLFVFDSADDLDQVKPLELIPDCRHGSVIITSISTPAPVAVRVLRLGGWPT